MAQNRHIHIAEDLRRQIAVGSFTPGSRLPSEAVLMERYGASRTTIREAVVKLENEGLIIRRHGLGNFVRHATGLITYNIDGRRAARSAVGATLEVQASHETVQADAGLSERLNIPLGSTVSVYTYKSHYMHDPCSLARVYVPQTVALLDVPVTGLSPTGEDVREALVKAHVRVAATVTRIASRLPVAEESRELRIGSGTAVLEIERITTDIDGQVVELTRIVLPGYGTEAVFTEQAPARELEAA